MKKPLRIEIIKKGNLYNVRTKAWLGWNYWGFDSCGVGCCWLIPDDWYDLETAELLIASLKRADVARNDESPIEVVYSNAS